MSPFGRRQPDSDRPRSAEERERARLEREARRAAREGRPAPSLPPLRDDEPEEAPAADRADRFTTNATEPDPPRAGEPVPPPAEEPAAGFDDALPSFDEPPSAEQPAVGFDDPPPPFGEEPRATDFGEPAAEPPEVGFAEPPSAERPATPEPEPEPEPATEPAPLDDPPAFLAPPEPPSEPAPLEDDRFGLAPAPAPADADADPQATQAWSLDDEPPAEPVAAADPHATQPFTPVDAPPITPPRAAAGPQPPPKPTYGDEHERPVPVRRLANRDRKLPPTPPPPGEEPKRRGRPRRGRILLVLLLLLLAGIAWVLVTLFQPFKGEGGDPVTVRIPTNSTADEVGDLLAERGVVDSAFVFTLRARLSGASLQAGTYRLNRDSTYSDAIDRLEAGPPPARIINVTIPEGRSRREAAPLIQEAGLSGSYLEASEKPTADFRPRRYGAPRNLRSLEGFLFPATYELKPDATARQLVAKQLDAFKENVANVSMRRARQRNLSTWDVLTIASMVEREASLAKERPLISAVIHNRLREGMPLGIDATIRFATRNWSRPLRQSELNIDSPYNTRRRTGLPPGPIGSPGLSSIKAAANPASVDHLFYVVKPCGDGAHNFSATDAEFQEDVAAYNREREKRGGKSPVNC